MDASDSTNGMPFRQYQTILDSLGFSPVLHVKDREDGLFVYAHRAKGILLRFTTYFGGINAADAHFNFRPRDPRRWICWGIGHFIDEATDIWVGTIDARARIRASLARLDHEGQFVVPWAKSQLLFLLTIDEKVKDHERIDRERVAALPEWVRAFVNYDR